MLWRGLGFEGIELPGNRVVVWCGLALAGIAVGVRLFFWWYTGRVWEDALITVLHSENCAAGLGLTHFRVGEGPVHGFSSPLSALIPLMADVFRPGLGLSWIRLVSAFAGGLTVLYVMALAIHPKIQLPSPLAIAAMAYAAVEHHQILWGMAGMETQVATLILVASAYYLIAESAVALGITLGLCMLARPDFAFWTVIAGGSVLIRSPRRFPVVVAIAVAVYAPWVVFATAYYGSPIPNTIVAKSLGYPLWSAAPDLTFAAVRDHVLSRISGRYLANSIFQPLGPSFAGHGTHFSRVVGDRGLVCQVMTALALVGAGASFFRKQWGFVPLVCFVAVYAAYYVFFVPIVFGWYVVPFILVVLLLSARGMQAVFAVIRRPGIRSAVLMVAAAVYVSVFVALTPKLFYTEKRIQEDIENQVRVQAGLYLGGVMKADETVGCEPAGYVGYYSRRTVYDWPGLTSKRVVAYSRAHPGGRTLLDMLEAIRPDYILLRPFEYEAAREQGRAWLDTQYKPVCRFEAPAERIRDILLLNRNIDVCFLLFRKSV